MSDELDIENDINRMRQNANKIINITDTMVHMRHMLVMMGNSEANGSLPIWSVNINQTHQWAFHADTSTRVETPEMLALRQKMAELMREWLTLAIGSAYELIQSTKEEI